MVVFNMRLLIRHIGIAEKDGHFFFTSSIVFKSKNAAEFAAIVRLAKGRLLQHNPPHDSTSAVSYSFCAVFAVYIRRTNRNDCRRKALSAPLWETAVSSFPIRRSMALKVIPLRRRNAAFNVAVAVALERYFFEKSCFFPEKTLDNSSLFLYNSTCIQ